MMDRAELLQQVYRLVRNKSLNEAASLLRDYIAGEGKEDMLAWTKLAAIYQEQGQLHLAHDIHLTAAKLFIKDCFYSRAVSLLKQVVNYAPECLEAYELISSSFMKMGLDREAEMNSLRVQELKEKLDKMAVGAEQLLKVIDLIKILVKKAKAGDASAKSELRKIQRMITPALKRPKVPAKKKSKVPAKKKSKSGK